MTTTDEFVNAVVFVGLPEIDGETSDDGYPAIVRVRNILSIGQVSFEMKIYLWVVFGNLGQLLL